MRVIHLHILAWFWSFHVVLLYRAGDQKFIWFVLTAVCFKQVVILFFQIWSLSALFDWTVKGRVLWRVARKISGYFWAKCRCIILFCYHVLLSHSHCQLLIHSVHAFLMCSDYGFLPSPFLDYIFEKWWATCDIWWEETPATLLLHHIIFQHRSEIRNKFKEMVLSRVQSLSNRLVSEQIPHSLDLSVAFMLWQVVIRRSLLRLRLSTLHYIPGWRLFFRNSWKTFIHILLLIID